MAALAWCKSGANKGACRLEFLMEGIHWLEGGSGEVSSAVGQEVGEVMKRAGLSISVLLPLAIAGWLYPYAEHISTSVRAFYTLATMPEEDISNFFKAYDRLETMGVDGRIGIKDDEDAKAVHDIYKVLNHICAAGVLMEIMLLPPAMDHKATVLQNIYLWQDRMIEQLRLKPGDRVLDTGSGRGKIAAYVSENTGADIIQINIDETQIQMGKEIAEQKGIADRMEFHVQDFNKPYPYLADGSLAGQYCAQACAFLADKKAHLKEMYRLLKPGGYVYNLEWLTKDFGERPENTLPGRYGAFDMGNATHRELTRRTGVIVGGAFPSGVLEWEEAFREAGFELIHSQDPGEVGSMLLFDRTNKVYEPLADMVVRLAEWGMLPKRLADLFLRLRKYWDSAVEAYEMELVSLSWEFVARKPLSAKA